MPRKSRIRVPRPNPSPTGRTGSRSNARDRRTVAPGNSAGKGSLRGQTMSGRLMGEAIVGHRQEQENRRIEAENLKILERQRAEEAQATQMVQRPAVGPGHSLAGTPGRPRDTSARPMTTQVPVVARVPSVATPATRNPAKVAPTKPKSQPMTKPAKRSISVPRSRSQRTR